MNDLTLDDKQMQLIKNLVGLRTIEIVWDINAFYFNTPLASFKLECLDASPTGSDYKYDEIFYCEFSECGTRLIFENNAHKYWYKIICSDCNVHSIQYINVVELFPENKLIPLERLYNYETGLNKSTLGLIVQTDKGFVPAFLLPSNHGFTWQPKFDFYSKDEIDQLLIDNIKFYEVVDVAG
ncbi:hypothetical protein [Hymenobacter daeguensis]